MTIESLGSCMSGTSGCSHNWHVVRSDYTPSFVSTTFNGREVTAQTDDTLVVIMMCTKCHEFKNVMR